MGLNKARHKPKRVSVPGEKCLHASEPDEGGSEEAAKLIAEVVESLAHLARRHDLSVLTYLLAMTQLEAEEQVKLIRRRKLS
jgi:hypothetical protein